MILYQVNRLLRKPQLIRQFLRFESGKINSSILYPLESRKLLKISGKDASVFLQGLITNDMRHFEEGAQSIYAMFLNNKGRVLYDTLIHKWEDEGSYLLECDQNILNMLQKHLKLYKLRRLVDITDVNTNFKLWALINPVEQDFKVDTKNDVNIYKDPRLTNLGCRILTTASLKSTDIAKYMNQNIVVENNEDGYKYLRYQLGVSEGADDLPPGSSFPLEANCDYLHGVSFHKGCYIGQELTARVHHTGVVRKRIMPVKFSANVQGLEKDAVISDSNKPKSNLGKLKSWLQDYGLGLLRVREVLETQEIAVSNHKVEVEKPSWWPIEAPKEKANVLKSE